MKKFAKILWEAARGLVANDGVELAGHIAYTVLLAIFPFIIFLTALAGFYSDTLTITRAVDLLFTVAPHEIQDVLGPVIHDIVSASRPDLLTFGILVTLWVTTGGVETLRLGLNRAYHVRESRSWWLRRLQALAYVFTLALLMLLLSVAIILGPLLAGMAEDWFVVPDYLAALWNLLRYGVVALAMVAVFSILYATLPDIRRKRFTILPGALIATVLWLLLATLFSVYISHFSSYSVTYGSLSGIIITMLFLNLSALIFLFGAEVNYMLCKEPPPQAA